MEFRVGDVFVSGPRDRWPGRVMLLARDPVRAQQWEYEYVDAAAGLRHKSQVSEYGVMHSLDRGLWMQVRQLPEVDEGL